MATRRKRRDRRKGAVSNEVRRPPVRGVAIKRIYAVPDSTDGYRVLIDRLWPRGISKERAAIDAWLTDLAPSTALRTWFHHDPKRWPEFSQRYRMELRARSALLQELRQKARRQRVTLLYAARDARFNQATVLREVLRRQPPAAAARRAAAGTRSATRGASPPRARARRS